jgi:uncharacterized membrane protein
MEETGLAFRPFLNPWFVLAATAACLLLSAASYRRTTRSVSPRFRVLLVGLRMGAVLAGALCLLRPTLETTHYELVKRPLLVLIDKSLSMAEICDMPDGRSRLEAVSRLLEENQTQLDALRQLYDVSLLGFARGLLGEAASRDEAALRHSAYGLALDQAFREATNGQSDAVVVIGDGSDNYGPPDPVDVAAALNAQGVPVYTVGVGQDETTSGLKDIKVLDVAVPKSAFLFASFTVRAQVQFRGCQGVTAKVRLDFPKRPPQETTVTVAHPDEMVPIEFEVLPEEVGDFRLTVRAEPVPGEVLDTNNSYATYVRVVSGGIRVGFFDTVRPESKFIGAALTGAEHVRVRRVLVLPGQRLPDPQTEMGRYDVFILGDLTADALPPSRLLELTRAVQQDGKGLVVLLTQRSAGRQGWRQTALEDVLPVKLPVAPTVAEGNRQFGVAPDHADDPILALGPTTEATRRAWASLPPLAGAVTGIELKRGAIVLAADQAGNPLLVVQRSGWGRVACLTADTTFRWFFTERNTQDYFRRFWRQLVMWAGGREEPPRSRLALELSKQRLSLKEELKVLVYLTGPGGEPIRDAQLDLRVTDPKGEAAALPATFSRQDGAYVADYRPAVSGDYLVTADARRGGESMGTDRSYFHASRSELELEEPMADLSLLRRMASVTSDSGGGYCYYTQASRLFEQLRKKGNPLKLTTQRRRDVWDGWPVFALYAACLATEWGLRKWKGLV